jgi:DnaJ-class molecular chaperone
MERNDDPERYNMAFCPICNGEGKLSKGPGGSAVCKKCGGFGLIKKESNASEDVEDR